MTIASGRYYARAQSYELGYSKTGTHQVAVRLVIQDEDNHDTADTIIWYGYLTEKAGQYAVRDLRTMGWFGDLGPNDDDWSRLIDDGLGTEVVEVVLQEEEYNGRTSLKVRSIFPVGGGGMIRDKFTEDKRSSFGLAVRGFVQATKPKADARLQGAPLAATGTTGARRF